MKENGFSRPSSVTENRFQPSICNRKPVSAVTENQFQLSKKTGFSLHTPQMVTEKEVGQPDEPDGHEGLDVEVEPEEGDGRHPEEEAAHQDGQDGARLRQLVLQDREVGT